VSATLSTEQLARLRARARRDVDEGLLPSCQIALALDGQIIHEEAFGTATTDTRYVVFSATKPFVAGVMWQLVSEGQIELSEPVATYVPAFATLGKEVVTVEQVMLHTSGFPNAPLGPPRWSTREGRLEAFARWRLEFTPGTAFQYHPTSAHWVLAELITAVTGEDHRDAVARRITGPLGLPRLLGLPVGDQHGVAPLAVTGEPAGPDELEAALGIRELPASEVTDAALVAFNDPSFREVGVPGGGGVMRAGDLARFYQALLHNPGPVWHADLLADVTGRVRNRLPDPLTGVPANRTLGLVQAGGDGHSAARGMGRTVSARAFGHNGAAGQIAFADPLSGLSFAYCTNGIDANVVRQWRRGSALASLAGSCVAP